MAGKQKLALVAFLMWGWFAIDGSLANAQISPGDTLIFDTPIFFEDTKDCGQVIPTAQCETGTDGVDQAFAITDIPIGVADDISVTATLFESFGITLPPSNEERPVSARISGTASWAGQLFVGGLGTNTAAVDIGVDLVDAADGTIAGSASLLSESLATGPTGNQSELLVGNNKSVSFDATVIRGHVYKLRLSIECRSVTTVGFASCAFVGVVLGRDGFLKWETFSVALETDTVELLENIQASLDALDAKVDVLDAKVDTLDGKIDSLDGKVDDLQEDVDLVLSRQLEEIRLLLTPQGRRETDVPACDGGPCKFPNKK